MRSTRLILLMLAFYLTFVGGASYYTLVFPVRIGHHILMTVLLAGWLITRVRNQHSKVGLPAMSLTLPLVGLAGVWFLTAVLSISPRLALENLWFGVLHLLIFVFIVDLLMRGQQRVVMELIFFMATLVVFISAIEIGSWYFGWGIIPGTEVGFVTATGRLLPALNELPTLSLAMSISTLLAGYVAPLITVSIGWALTARQRDYRVVLWLLALLLLGVLLLTDSRGGYLSAGIAMGALITLRAMHHPRVTRLIKPRQLLVIAGVLIALVATGFIALTLSRGDNGSNGGRLDMWRSAVRIFADHPLTGVGYSQFGRAFRDYRDPTQVQDKLASAHNLVLNTLAETGIIGMAAALVIGFLVLRLFWRNYQQSADAIHRLRLEAVACALLGVAVHSMVDVFSITPIVVMLSVLIAYAITPLPASRLVSIPAGNRRLAAAVALVVAVTGVAKLWADSAQAAYMTGFARNTATEALADTAIAQSVDAALTLYTLQDAWLNDIAGNPSAVARYSAALAQEPTWELGWANLAALYEANGDLTAAFSAMDHVIHINRHSVMQVHWARLAEATASASDEQIVTAYLASMGDAFVQWQVLPLTPFWDETPLRRQALADFAMRAPLDWQYRLWQAHDPTRLEALVPVAPQTANDWWVVGEHALLNASTQAQIIEAEEAFRHAAALCVGTEGCGDYYASVARAQIAQNAPQTNIEHTLDQAAYYGVWLEPVAELRTSLQSNGQASESAVQQNQPVLTGAPEFASVMYGRPSIFSYAASLAYPDR